MCNVDDSAAVDGNAYVEAVREAIRDEGAQLMIVAARTESEIAELDTWEERREFLEALGLEESGVSRLIRAAYALLDLQTYFTAGPDEVRAWTFLRGTKAPQAAGIIHTDFEKGFIRAEVIKYDDYVSLGSESAVRDAGKLGWKERSMWCRTATSCTSASTCKGGDMTGFLVFVDLVTG